MMSESSPVVVWRQQRFPGSGLKALKMTTSRRSSVPKGAALAVGSSSGHAGPSSPTRRASLASANRRYSFAQLVFGTSTLIKQNFPVPPREWYSSDEEEENPDKGHSLEN
ncbi:hypothetical protein GCK32_013410 [Trichostrongylus colubriformis]|uniref:Uncharacterized protein n=1 Tax=Trichostrongylus colubriformis TaxID=6319 RepID=A0AAN8IQK3_TRICO